MDEGVVGVEVPVQLHDPARVGGRVSRAAGSRWTAGPRLSGARCGVNTEGRFQARICLDLGRVAVSRRTLRGSRRRSKMEVRAEAFLPAPVTPEMASRPPRRRQAASPARTAGAAANDVAVGSNPRGPRNALAPLHGPARDARDRQGNSSGRPKAARCNRSVAVNEGVAYPALVDGRVLLPKSADRSTTVTPCARPVAAPSRAPRCAAKPGTRGRHASSAQGRRAWRSEDQVAPVSQG